MAVPSRYIAHSPDPHGVIHYTAFEHAVWRDLSARQRARLPGRACAQYIDALAALDLPRACIPQCVELSERLEAATGWALAPVAALIDFDEFFALLAQRVFPAASFIRSRDEFDYVREPDIFHEIFGHVPLLMEPTLADFSQRIGEIGHTAGSDYHVWLARLYWMTIEFGLVNTRAGLRAYGAGIISSHQELTYALDSDVPQRRPFNIMDVLRTPYRIDRLQPIYFVVQEFRELAELSESNLLARIDEARELGLFESPLRGNSMQRKTLPTVGRQG